MDKSTLTIFISILFLGCSKTVEFSNPAVQANNEGQSWISTVETAAIKNSGLIIRASRGSEVLILFTTRTDIGEYALGGNNQNEARYRDDNGVMYSTLNAPDESVQVFPSDGVVEIENIDSENNTATGTFWFNAFTEDGLNTINFSSGVFFQVPIRQNILEVTGGVTCDMATATINDLQIEITAFEPIPDADVCLQYQEALEIQILSCGDSEATLQALLDNVDCDDDDGDGHPNSFEDINMDGNLDNDDTDMNGIPNYLDSDDDGDGILTTDETGDLDGDGIPNYLDEDDDGDGVFTIFEGSTTLQNTDADALFDYLDVDDDGDGIGTASENPDPNGDGNPNDAQDTDMDGVPDYLQA